MPISVFSHPDCELHAPEGDHPERPARIGAIFDQMIRSGMEFAVTQKEATAAPREALYQAHSQLYVDDLIARSPQQGHIWLDPDTLMTPHSLRAATLAAGAAINAVDDVMQASNQQAFCAVRPPGHHATRDQAMGFCLFNNIAVAACHALRHYKLERVAIIDFDVHHGNGTEDIFKNDERVLFCSSFQSQFYPFTGEDTNSPHIINVPLAAGCKSMQWREAVFKPWTDALHAFKPELILISAGFDGHAEDDMAQFFLVEDDYYWISQHLKKIADTYCDGRVVSTLEGGYDLSALGRSVVAHLKGLM